jgi:sulfatase modifying factor 1
VDELVLSFDGDLRFPFAFVQGTGESLFTFGTPREKQDRKLQEIAISDFYMSQYLVTRELWERVMRDATSQTGNEQIPVDHVSFNEIAGERGFLERLNAHASTRRLSTEFNGDLGFRLPSETEWEYAARGGVHWQDDFIFSGGNDLDGVGWYQANSENSVRPVGQKAPNQLGLYDMSGDLWEWCQDYFHRDTDKVPKDGRACEDVSNFRVLRGGCHNNGPMHCTATWRYEIEPDYKDGCIGFRLAVSL